MAARFAQSCGAKQLVLTHFSRRYSSRLVPDLAEQLGEEARRVLAGGKEVAVNSEQGRRVVVAKDFLVLDGQGKDGAFRPEASLAVKYNPWHRSSSPDCGG